MAGLGVLYIELSQDLNSYMKRMTTVVWKFLIWKKQRKIAIILSVIVLYSLLSMPFRSEEMRS